MDKLQILFNQHKLTSLDALRGLAILFVIIAHFAAGQTGVEASILFGNAGVILFFFLSGFLMDRTLNQDRNLVSYALRRAFRILPMYWVSLLLVAVLTGGWSANQLLANAVFAAPAFGFERMLGVYWTLYIEVLFYCLVPLLFLAGSKTILASTYVALALFGALAFFRGVGTGAPFYMIFCLCGLQIGAWQRGKLSMLQVCLSISAVCICASILMPVSIYLGPVALGCAVLLIGGLQFPLRLPALEFFGKVSYSWYLLHSIFGYNLMAYAMPQWLALLVGALFTLGLSVLTYRFIEAPVINVGKAAVQKWRARNQQVSPAADPARWR